MIVEKDSPLRNLPRAMNPSQAGFMDGIRLSAEVVDLALSRLEATLLELSEKGLPPDPEAALVASAFSDAWTVVDATNRIRELIRQMPGLKQNANHRLLLMRTTAIERLRDALQHINNEIPGLSAAGQSVWGELRWIAMPRPETHMAKACVLIGGRIHTGAHRLPNPSGRPIKCPIDHVSLRLGTNEAELAVCRDTVVAVVKGLETSLGTIDSADPTTGADMLLVVDLAFAPTESGTDSSSSAA